jgi:hypothetical protein
MALTQQQIEKVCQIQIDIVKLQKELQTLSTTYATNRQAKQDEITAKLAELEKI